MNSSISRQEIIENLELLSDWLRVKAPGAQFELLVVGGAALALTGCKKQTHDIDLLKPHPLSEPLRRGIQAIAKARKISADWLNDSAARVLNTGARSPSKRLPQYFDEITESIPIGENLRIQLIGRQALISMKLFACNPSVRKHIDDLRVLRPTAEEIKIAALFCLERDPHPTSRRDLVQVINELGFEVDEVLEDID